MGITSITDGSKGTTSPVRNSVTTAVNYSAYISDDYIYADATGATVAITLPDPTTMPDARDPIWVIKTDASANDVTVSAAVGLINGLATQTIASQNSVFGFVREGANYRVV